jgi:phosphoglycerate dehydrogenase-like enzyme
MPDLRFSRWGRSAYETDEALAAEEAALSALLQPAGFRADAEFVAVNSKTRVDDALLDQMPSARVIVTTTSGYEHMDLHAIHARGITPARLPLARRDAVVESALGMILDFTRRHATLRQDASGGRWVRAALPGMGLSTLRGASVGLVGMGVIGTRMAEVLTVLGASVCGNDPAGLPEGMAEASVDDMLQRCDVLSLHCRLTDDNRGFISRERILSARKGLILINTARGGLMDVDAAVSAAKRGILGGLGVDVFPEEPWPRMSQAADGQRILFTPHASGYHDRLTEVICEGLVDAASALVAEQNIPWNLTLNLS